MSEYRLATGEHRVLIDSFASWFSPDPAVSPDGRLLAYETTFQDDQTNTYEDATIWLIRRGDRVKWEFPVPYNARSAEFSPDGKKILHLGEIDGKWQVMLANLDGTDQQQLTFDDANKDSPKFSPDGKAIAYRTHPGPSILVIQDLSSGNTREFSLPGWGSELTEWTRQFPFKASRYMFKPRTINIRTFNPGNLHIAGKNIKKTSRRLATPGKTTISIRWTGKRKKNKIQQTTLRIRFKPDGSIPTTQTRQARR